MSKQPSGGAGGVVIEDVGPSRKRLTFSIPADRVSEQLESSFGALASEAALPGFRPGRAPRRLIEKRFGAAIGQEAKTQLVSEAFRSAVQDHKLRVLGDPEGNEELAKLEVKPGQPVNFTLEVEVAPEITLPKLDGIEVYKPVIEPTQEQVDEQIQRVAINEGSLAPQDRAAPGDYCIGHGVMKTSDGTVVLDVPGAVIQVPAAGKDAKGAILGVLVGDFGVQVGLPRPGDELKITSVGPEGHENEQVRGKPIEIAYTVERVERILPLGTPELLERFGFADEPAMREAMMQRLRQRAAIEQQMAMRQQVARHLTGSVEVALPERITTRQAERNLQRARMELLYRGLDAQQVEQRLAELRAASSEAARRELKLFFILARVAEETRVQVSEQEVMGRIAQMAAERGERPEQLRRELQQSNQLNLIAQQIAEHKSLDALVNRARVTELPLEEFNAKMRALAGGSEVETPAAAPAKKPSKKKDG